MKRVLLLSMPFGALERQALGLSLLKAEIGKAGIPCDIRYFSFTFAEFIGNVEYQWISSSLPYTAFAGDWVFTHDLYGQDASRESQYVHEVLRSTWSLSWLDIERILRVRSLTRPFLEHCLAATNWKEYAIVGFTSTFEQNIASLALAQRIKAAYPQISLVFGGANWEGEMGLELHRRFSFVDYVCSGEAEQSFPELVQHILHNRRDASVASQIKGIVYRDRGASISTGPAEVVRRMDDLPVPDYSDYFHDLEESTVAPHIIPTLLFESSRGCWWGQKSHCTFCGLNGGSLVFRSKSAKRVLEELDQLITRWHVDYVEAVDNILNMNYFDDLLPALAHSARPVNIFFETKANLNRTQVCKLKQAGVTRIQPGIESLSDHVLRLMRKGTTGLRNIQLLKWCKQYNIQADWNILYGFPGETREDYDAMLALLPAIRFLSPPTGCGPIRLDRFSPYFDSSSSFGLTNVRPLKCYEYLYPFEPESLRQIAYYFDYDYMATSNPTGCAEQVVRYALEWQNYPEHGTLSCVKDDEGALVIVDTRNSASFPQLTLRGIDRAAYEFCDEVHSISAILAYLQGTFPSLSITETQVRGFFDSLVCNHLALGDGAHYLSLAISDAPLDQSPHSPLTDSAEPAVSGSGYNRRRSVLDSVSSGAA